MYLKQLTIHHLRNFQEVTLPLSSGFNLFVGKNGSGKTSLLEAVYLLATGQSFRTHRVQDYINFEKPHCCITGQILPLKTGQGTHIRVGIQRDRQGGREIRINEEECRTRVELAKILPVQIMNTESYQLFDLPPKYRRAFLDWGVFHVEHSFISLWARYHRVLKQRNAAIKRVRIAGEGLVLAWERELAELGERIHSLRTQFIEDFMPVFQPYLVDFLKIAPLIASYHRGWSEEITLEEALVTMRARDLALGYTTVGPHRADFRFNLDERPIESIFSRGQLKLFVAALMLARSAWLLSKNSRQSLFLLDDLSSELDNEACFRLLQGLRQMGGQVWITSIEYESALVEFVKEGGVHMFHVEHGQVKAGALAIS